VINRHPLGEDSQILDPLSSFDPIFDRSNQSNRSMTVETSSQFLGDVTQPDSSDVQRWDKIRCNRASKYRKSSINISSVTISPKHITKHRLGDRKVIKSKNTSAERDNSKSEAIALRVSSQGVIERDGSKGTSSSSSPPSALSAIRQEVTTCPTSPVDYPFTSYITAEYVTPLGVCSEEWRGLQMALRGAALDIQQMDLIDLLDGSLGDAETAVGWVSCYTV
jgi:hypothetical protein